MVLICFTLDGEGSGRVGESDGKFVLIEEHLEWEICGKAFPDSGFQLFPT